MIKRFFDIFSSLIAIICIAPFLLVIALLVKATSKGPVLFKQERVGLNEQIFWIYKFRSMYVDTDPTHIITAHKDSRITKIGYYLRHYKLDELPQLFNVLKGDMSVVGPRPQMKKLVSHYPVHLRKIIFSVRPGLTDIASIHFSNEQQMLSHVVDQEAFYLNKILPRKLKYKVFYAKKHSLLLDLEIIFMTIYKIFIKGN